MAKGKKQGDVAVVLSQAGVDIPVRLTRDVVGFAQAVANGCTNVTAEQVMAVWFVTRLLQMPPMAPPAKKATKKRARA